MLGTIVRDPADDFHFHAAVRLLALLNAVGCDCDDGELWIVTKTRMAERLSSYGPMFDDPMPWRFRAYRARHARHLTLEAIHVDRPHTVFKFHSYEENDVIQRAGAVILSCSFPKRSFCRERSRS